MTKTKKVGIDWSKKDIYEGIRRPDLKPKENKTMKTQKELREEVSPEEKELVEKAKSLLEKLSTQGKPGIVDFDLARLAGVKTLKLFMLRGMVNAYELGKKEALQAREKEMKGIVKKSKPVFFIGKGMTDECDRVVSNAIHETKAQIYEDLFERKEK